MQLGFDDTSRHLAEHSVRDDTGAYAGRDARENEHREIDEHPQIGHGDGRDHELPQVVEDSPGHADPYHGEQIRPPEDPHDEKAHHSAGK